MTFKVGGMLRHFASLRTKPSQRKKHEHLRVGALLEEGKLVEWISKGYD